jgi:ABC-type lipoprotein export system ATPase subunit
MNDSGASVLRARGLRKEYGKGEGLVRAVDEVDLDVATGETVAVMGPSGCGKSTLLLLGGLDRPTGGGLWPAGQRLDQMGERALARLRRDAVGFVFQAFHLMDELTAVENVEPPALLAGRSARAARRRASALLDQVGLADRAAFLPSALSGGQRQRVAIARALVSDPQVVLADEPTGNLDNQATAEVLRLFEGLHEAGQTLVIVTHDSRIGRPAGLMDGRRGARHPGRGRRTGRDPGARWLPPVRDRDRAVREGLIQCRAGPVAGVGPGPAGLRDGLPPPELPGSGHGSRFFPASQQTGRGPPSPDSAFPGGAYAISSSARLAGT